MEAVAFCGRKSIKSVQITIRGKATYGFNQAQLTELQVRELIKVLQERLE